MQNEIAYKMASELSFLTNDQKRYFENYRLYMDGIVYNEKTGKEVSKTKHGTRGYVVNLSRYIDGRRRQKQICIGRAIADLFIRPVKDDEIIEYADKNKENFEPSNLKYKKINKMEKNGI